MNTARPTATRDAHLSTIKGLIQTTVNLTFVDLGRRQLITDTTAIDWTNLRSLHNEINFLFSETPDSAREENTLDNLITEVHVRAANVYPGLADPDQFDQNLRQGIKIYSQYLRRRTVTSPQIRIDQTLEEQYNWGILENCVHVSQINHRIRQYREFVSELNKIIRRAVRRIGAIYNSNRDLRT